MIVAPQPDATEVGARTFLKGGNAADAAIACAFAQFVMDQFECGLAGSSICQIFNPTQGLHECISAVFTAPMSAKEGMWEDIFDCQMYDGYGFVVEGRVNELGYTSVAASGNIKALQHLHSRHGRLAWRDLIEPAIDFAENGYTVTPYVYDYWTAHDPTGRVQNVERMAYTKAYAHLFFGSDGGVLPVGSIVRNPDLATTLRQIAQEGAEVFYQGDIAERMDTDFRKNGGLLTKADFENFVLQLDDPLWGSYRGIRVAATRPPGIGLMLLKMLKTLEHFDLVGLGHNTPEYIALVSEVMKRGQVAKDSMIGDPRFFDAPDQEFLDPQVAEREAKAIRDGEICHVARATADAPSTTHISAVDEQGTCVSLTHTNGKLSGVITPGLGFMYNGGIASFDPRSGNRQSLAPGRRRANFMTPTMLFRGDNPYVVLGAPGGAHIPMAVLQVILNIVDFGMSISEAVDAPRFSTVSDIIDVPARIPQYTCDALEAKGYQARRSHKSYLCARVHAILIDSEDELHGAADPWNQGVALAV